MISNNSELSFEDRFNKIGESIQDSEKESGWESFKRNYMQKQARIYETALGLPGNTKKAFSDTLNYIESLLPKPEGIKSLKEQEKETFGSPSEGGIVDLLYNPPTSEEIRKKHTSKVAKAISGKESYLEPQNEREEKEGEVIQDIANMFMPGTGRFRLMTRLGAPIFANMAKEGVKLVGGSESTAEKAKMGVMLATTLSSQSNPGRFATERIRDAKNMIPQTARFSTSNFEPQLNALHHQLNRGLQVPSKSRTQQGIRRLRQQIQNGEIDAHSLMTARDNINEWISEAGGFDVPTDIRDATVRNLNNLKREIIHTIDYNLARRYPQAAELYQTGYEAAAVNHQSNAISNFIERNYGRTAASIGAKLLFPAMAGGAAILPKTVGVAALGYPLYKTGQVLYRVANSPTLSAYYGDVIRHSLQGNASAMAKSLRKLDEELKKVEEKELKGKKLPFEDFKSRLMNKD